MSEKIKEYRAKKSEELGADEFRRQESEKRKARRHRATARQTAPATEPVEPEPVEEVKVEDVKEPEESFDDMLYRLKSEQIKPKTILKKTILSNITRIRVLYKNMFDKEMGNDLEFLRDTAKVKKFIIEKYNNDNTQKAYYSSISSILGILPNYKSVYQFYSDLVLEKKAVIDKIIGENTSSERDAKNYVPWSKLKVLYKTVPDPREKALVALYTLLPPRRVEDVSLITLNSKEDDLNELVLEGGKPISIIYRKFKTDKTSPEITVKIPSALSIILQNYILVEGINDNDPLFGTANRNHIKNFSEYITKIFMKYTGVSVGANSLRHSFLSDFLSKIHTTNQKDKIAKLMGNGIGTQHIYLKIDQIE